MEGRTDVNENEVWRIIKVFRMEPLVDRTVHTLLMLMWQVVFSTQGHNDIFYHINFSRILSHPHQGVEYMPLSFGL